MNAADPRPHQTLALEAPSRGCCGGKPEPPVSPQLQSRIASLANSVVAITRSGFKLTEDQLRQQRIAVCSGQDGHPVCPAYAALFCRDCKCFLPLKTRFAVEKCPRDMWPTVAATGERPAELINPSTDLGTIAVVIPYYGDLAATYRTVKEVCVEPVGVVVVDCKGDYIHVLEEVVVVPGAALPWQAAVDYGVKYAWEEEIPQAVELPLLRKYRFAVPLAAGAGLSPDYFRNLLWAYRETDADVVTPLAASLPAVNYEVTWRTAPINKPRLQGSLLTREGYPQATRAVATSAACLNPAETPGYTPSED